jgi:hypothetical protein
MRIMSLLDRPRTVTPRGSDAVAAVADAAAAVDPAATVGDAPAEVAAPTAADDAGPTAPARTMGVLKSIMTVAWG